MTVCRGITRYTFDVFDNKLRVNCERCGRTLCLAVSLLLASEEAKAALCQEMIDHVSLEHRTGINAG